MSWAGFFRSSISLCSLIDCLTLSWLIGAQRRSFVDLSFSAGGNRIFLFDSVQMLFAKSGRLLNERSGWLDECRNHPAYSCFILCVSIFPLQDVRVESGL